MAHVRGVGDAQRLRLGIGAEVEVTLGQTEPALIDLADHLAAFLRIDFGVQRERSVDATRREPGELLAQVFARLDPVDAREIGRDRLRTLAVRAGRIHQHGVQRSELLQRRILLGRRLRGRTVEHLMEDFLVVVEHQAAGADSRVRRRDLGLVEPTAVCVAPEILARRAGRVAERGIDTVRFSARGSG